MAGGPYLQAQNQGNELLPANFRARHKRYKSNTVPDKRAPNPAARHAGGAPAIPRRPRHRQNLTNQKKSRSCLIAGCNILSNSTSSNRNQTDFDKNSPPNLTEIVPIMNMIPVGTPGLVADVGNADTPEASSHSKTPRKGAEREAHFHKFKRTAYKVYEI